MIVSNGEDILNGGLPLSVDEELTFPVRLYSERMLFTVRKLTFNPSATRFAGFLVETILPSSFS